MTLVQDNSVQAINTALLSIKRDISASTATTAGTTAGLEPGKTYNINISGNAETATTAKTARTATNANHAETAETATKMSNALTVNGKTYDGSEAVDAGVQTVENGGTGVTTQADINKAFIGNLEVGSSDVTDGTEFVSSYASDNGFAEAAEGALNKPYKRQFVKVWNYIKGKISSVLGLTKDNYGGKASTAGTADYANNLTAGAALNGNNAITTTNPTKIGAGQIKVHTVYGGNGPATYGNLINIGGSGGFQFFVEWTGGQTQAGQDIISRIFTRSWRDNQSAWTAWKELAYNTADVTFNTAKASNKMVIPIGAPSSLEDGCIWIER